MCSLLLNQLNSVNTIKFRQKMRYYLLPGEVSSGEVVVKDLWTVYGWVSLCITLQLLYFSKDRNDYYITYIIFPWHWFLEQ